MPSDRPLTFDIPLSDFDLGQLPPAARSIGSAAFDDAVLMYFMGQYADKGINAAVSVDSRAIHVTLIPEYPRSLLDHAVSLMREGKLADGIDILEWLRENTDANADVLYNLGIARSERGQFADAIEALAACTALDSGYVDAWIGLGVAYQRLDQPGNAEQALRKAIALDPGSGFAHRHLGAVLLATSRAAEAVPHFREAVHQLPDDPGVRYGLAQSLFETGNPDLRKERGQLLRQIIARFPEHPVAEMARTDQTRVAHDVLRSRATGLRMDVVTYIIDAMRRFSAMNRQDVGKMTLEIATLGQSGLDINDPQRRYQIKSAPGEEFTGLQLLSMMHAGVRQFQKDAETGADFDAEYAMALSMSGEDEAGAA